MSATEETRMTTTFDGKQANYGMFRTQIKGEFMAKGIQAALGLNFKDELPASEGASSQSKKEIEAVKNNITGMGLLIRAIKNASLLVKIEKTASEDWPNGRVDLVVAMLDKKFRPKDTMARAEQKLRLGELTLQDGEDPDDFSTKVATLEMEFNNVLEEDDKIATLFSVSGEKYATMILSERKLLESRGEDVTFDALVDAMRELWRVSRKRKGPSGSNETELADANYMSNFAKNKECFHCGEKGHIKHQCPKLKDKSGTQLGFVYELCGQMGHTKDRCWEDPKNANRRPGNWVSRLKKPNDEATTGFVEIIL
jgi:hypothetical protein